MQETWDTGSVTGSGRSPGGGHGNPLQDSSLENPWTEEPVRLQSIGSKRAGHDWSDLVHTVVSRHRCPSLQTSSRWPWSPLDSKRLVYTPDMRLLEAPEPILCTSLDERTRKPRTCLNPLLCCSGAPCHSDMVTSSHFYFLRSCGRGGREAVRGLLPPQVPLRNQCTSKCPIASTPTLLGEFDIFGGCDKLHTWIITTLFSLNLLLKALTSCSKSGL